MASSALKQKAQEWATRFQVVAKTKAREELYKWRQRRACTIRKGDRVLVDGLIYIVVHTSPSDGEIEVWLSRKNKTYRVFLDTASLVTKDCNND